ncbi:MAG: PSD1 domain-containing protein [Opitutaceae bacterium]|nr:PSD1 domain-containing protein [Opitutaceae bacterium]
MHSVSAALFITLGVVPGALASASIDNEALFVRRIAPMLKEKCLACHGDDESKIKGGLDLRNRASMLEGGDSGPAVLLGKAAESPLLLAVLRESEDFEPMPPKESEKLYSEQIGWLRQWIDGGAPWPNPARQQELVAANAAKWAEEDGVIVATTGALSSAWANRRYKPDGLWAYQRVAHPTPPTGHAPHPIDAFLESRMPRAAKPAPAATPRDLIRRATFDLIGLPPTPKEVAAFEAASHRDPAGSMRELVERLLASPHYGERWARHWLDVVRYADSSGFANDFERGNAWRYRDYVVRSFNSDKPYDQFIKEQIAGDELTTGEDDPAVAAERLIATGMLRMGPWELTGMEVPKIARQRFLDDVTNSVGETFLSHSLQCARCHDHKFDPVPTHDYYSFQAIFAATQLTERMAQFLKAENTAGFEEQRHLETLRKHYETELHRLDDQSLRESEKWFAENGRDRNAWDAAVAAARERIASGKKGFNETRGVFDTARKALEAQKVPESDYPPWGIGFTPDDFGLQRVAEKGLQRLAWEMDRYQPIAFSVYNGVTPDRIAVTTPVRVPKDPMKGGELEATAILTGGDPFAPSTKVRPGALSVLTSIGSLPTDFPGDVSGRRLALANWIAHPDNPLTTRSIVNRIWLWHFGQAIAGNPNNFGSTGKRPTHPELLDWLASEFIAHGWSFKAMHRLIMTSDAYRRAAELPAGVTKLSREEQEQSYLVFKPRRLSSEELRDAMLATTGELNPVLGGIPNRPEINLEVALQPRQVMGTFASAWVPNERPEQRHRRSLYALRIRGLRDPFMEVFNEPGPDFSCEGREVSTVTPQVFSLFNSRSVADRALALAHRALSETGGSGRRSETAVKRVFQLAFQRDPTASQLALTLDHWKKMETRQTGITFQAAPPPLAITREGIEENTGEKFVFSENLPGYADFIPDLQPADVDARTRALADVCLVLFNSAEFSYLY